MAHQACRSLTPLANSAFTLKIRRLIKVNTACSPLLMKANAMQDYAFCGVGLQSMTDGDTNVVPVVVLEPAPTCEFWPEPKFTIAAGSFQAGQTVDPSTLKQQVMIDFTDKDDDIATVDFKNPGTFDNLAFSSSSQ